jgi:hypothetical protein
LLYDEKYAHVVNTPAPIDMNIYLYGSDMIIGRVRVRV